MFLVAQQCYYDNFGVLRRGSDVRNREEELRLVLEAESRESAMAKVFEKAPIDAFETDQSAKKRKEKRKDDDEEEESNFAEDWRVLNAAWLHQWLAFVHYNKQRSAPGPVRNEHLLYLDDQGWRGKPKLIFACKDAKSDSRGHYRYIRPSTWNIICQLYPGSGPEIRAVGPPFQMETWVVDTRFMLIIKGAQEEDTAHHHHGSYTDAPTALHDFTVTNDSTGASRQLLRKSSDFQHFIHDTIHPSHAAQDQQQEQQVV